MFVVIEGGDGCGKTSVARTLADVLGGWELIHFPDNSVVTGPLIRSYLRKEWRITRDWVGQDDPAGAQAFQALHVVNKLERMPDLLRCVDSPRFHVIAVRYWQSAWVYGQLDGHDPGWLEILHSTMARPDLNILLDVPGSVAHARREGRDAGPPERYEGSVRTAGKISKAYLDLWGRHAKDPRWRIVDASRPFEEVVDACAEIVLRRARPC